MNLFYNQEKELKDFNNFTNYKINQINQWYNNKKENFIKDYEKRKKNYYLIISKVFIQK